EERPRVGAGPHPYLNEVRRVERQTQRWGGHTIDEVAAPFVSIAVDVRLVLVNQGDGVDVRLTRKRRHPPQHLVPVVTVATVWHVEREDSNQRRAQPVCRRERGAEAAQLLREFSFDGGLADRRPDR